MCSVSCFAHREEEHIKFEQSVFNCTRTVESVCHVTDTESDCFPVKVGAATLLWITVDEAGLVYET